MLVRNWGSAQFAKHFPTVRTHKAEPISGKDQNRRIRAEAEPDCVAAANFLCICIEGANDVEHKRQIAAGCPATERASHLCKGLSRRLVRRNASAKFVLVPFPVRIEGGRVQARD